MKVKIIRTSIVIITLCLAVSSIFAQTVRTEKELFHILTNDSTRYWEFFNQGYYNRYTVGISFSADSTWSDYVIDYQGKHVIAVDNHHRGFGQEFKFSIQNDSLILNYYSRLGESWLLYRIYTICIINDSCIQMTYNRTFWDNQNKTLYTKLDGVFYDSADDQFTKPKYGRILYPDDKTKWSLGDLSDSPVRLINCEEE